MSFPLGMYAGGDAVCLQLGHSTNTTFDVPSDDSLRVHYDTGDWYMKISGNWVQFANMFTSGYTPPTNGSFTITGNGFSGSVTGTAEYNVNGKIAILSLPALSGTSNSTSFTLSGLPNILVPTSSRNVAAVQVTNAGVGSLGSLTVNTNNTITVSSGLLGSLFGALLTKGCSKQDIVYLI